MSDYPVILIPSQIARVAEVLPPLALPPEPPGPQFPPAPKAPGLQPQPVELGAITPTIAIAGVMGLFFAMTALASSPGVGILLLVLTAIVVGGLYFNYAGKQKASYQQRIQGWQNHKAQYQKLLQAHEAEKHKIKQTHAEEQLEYEKECERIEAETHSPRNIQVFRNQLLAEILKQVASFDGDNSHAQQGYHEPKLRICLRKYFPCKIHTGLYLEIPNFDYPYSPDFAYIDDSNNLHIDIELDEPYVYRTGKPHHCIGDDVRRNDFFLSRGWVVVRFSEEQVVCHTESCCKEVAKIIAHITGDSNVLRPFSSVKDLPRLPRWTEEEAEEMARLNTRNSYCC